MSKGNLGLAARVMSSIQRWIRARPTPRQVFGRAERWLPLCVFLGVGGLVLFLLMGEAFPIEAGQWVVGAVALPLWTLRVATLYSEDLTTGRFGAAFPMVRWWIAGVVVVSVMWGPLGRLGAGLTFVVSLLFLFLAYGKYVLVSRDGGL